MRWFAISITVPVVLADLPVTVPLPGNKDGKGHDCVSWWCPMLLSTNTNTTLLFGCCKTATRGEILSTMISSDDAGKTWSKPITPPGLGQAVYSSKSGTIIMTVGIANRGLGAAEQYARYGRHQPSHAPLSHTGSLTHSLTHSPNHSPTHSLTHSPTHPLLALIAAGCARRRSRSSSRWTHRRVRAPRRARRS